MAIKKATGCNGAARLPPVQKWRLLKLTRVARPSTLTSLPSSRCIVGKDPTALRVLLQTETGRGLDWAAAREGRDFGWATARGRDLDRTAANEGRGFHRAAATGGVASAGLQAANELISAAAERQVGVHRHIYEDSRHKLKRRS